LESCNFVLQSYAIILNIPPANSPLQALKHPLFSEKGVQVYMKRDDLLHPQIMGNKWRKLYYNLLEARFLQLDTLVSYGGAYSNHIHALAYAGKLFGFKTKGIIRGEELHAQANNTLSEAQAWGMELQFVTREQYRSKGYLPLPNEYLLPEGGANNLAFKGVQQIVSEISEDITPTHICTALGTGTTAVGLAQAAANLEVRAYPVIKGFKLDTQQFPFNALPKGALFTVSDYANRLAYGKTDNRLLEFITFFEDTFALSLEQVYTGKMLEAFWEELQKDYFKPNSIIVLLHTGGLQGKTI
jgi:1-aminocyclopropane-1-carboxylate deaminase